MMVRIVHRIRMMPTSLPSASARSSCSPAVPASRTRAA